MAHVLDNSHSRLKLDDTVALRCEVETAVLKDGHTVNITSLTTFYACYTI